MRFDEFENVSGRDTPIDEILLLSRQIVTSIPGFELLEKSSYVNGVTKI